MGDLERARVWPFVPDVILSAWSSEATTQTKELPSSGLSIEHLFCPTDC